MHVVGWKKKGRIYGAWQLVVNYMVGIGSLKHQPSSSTNANDTVFQLTHRLERRDQEYNDLRQEFANFKQLVMRLLPESS